MGITFKVKLNITPYDLMREAIEGGVAMGYRRAYKHVDNPSEEEVRKSIENEVYNSLCELFDFTQED